MFTTAEEFILHFLYYLFIVYAQYRIPTAYRALQCNCIMQLKDPRVYLEKWMTIVGNFWPVLCSMYELVCLLLCWYQCRLVSWPQDCHVCTYCLYFTCLLYSLEIDILLTQLQYLQPFLATVFPGKPFFIMHTKSCECVSWI